MKEKKGEEESKAKEAARQADENFGNSKLGKFRTFVWNLMEYPETSRAAQVSKMIFFNIWVPYSGFCHAEKWLFLQIFAWGSLGMVLVSTFTFILGTLPGAVDCFISFFIYITTNLTNQHAFLRIPKGV